MDQNIFVAFFFVEPGDYGNSGPSGEICVNELELRKAKAHVRLVKKILVHNLIYAMKRD